MPKWKVNRHSYHTLGVDGAVLKAQAERRRDRDAETTVVHAHAWETDSQRVVCNEKCMVYRPGYGTYHINETPVEKRVEV